MFGDGSKLIVVGDRVHATNDRVQRRVYLVESPARKREKFRRLNLAFGHQTGKAQGVVPDVFAVFHGNPAVA